MEKKDLNEKISFTLSAIYCMYLIILRGGEKTKNEEKAAKQKSEETCTGGSSANIRRKEPSRSRLCKVDTVR